MKHLLLVVMLAACGTEDTAPGYAGLEPGTASAAELRFQAAASNASDAPFVAMTGVVTGDPSAELEVVFTDGSRTLTFTLAGRFAEEQSFDRFAVYRESETLAWTSRPAIDLGGALTITAADGDGFSFQMATIMDASTPDATAQIIFDGEGDVAFP